MSPEPERLPSVPEAVLGSNEETVMAQDWTNNPSAVAQYQRLVHHPEGPRKARDIALGLLGMDPPPVFRAAIRSAISEIDYDLQPERITD